jgi:inosine-uridine nucleoside N-ribohydrolase
MNDRTVKMTAAEIAKLDTMPNLGEIQQETLALRKRTGIRYGTQIGAGKWDVVTTAYALNKKGVPSGVAAITVVIGGLTQGDVASALRSL